MSLEYARGKRLWLKDHRDYREVWLRDLIARDPSILGLGTLQVRQVERPVPGSGRLDLLLQSHQRGRRYVVEIMLGRMDESHIIRCMEYWDFEQRRSPRYAHCAVLIAEEVQARFQNVLLLLQRVMPVIAWNSAPSRWAIKWWCTLPRSWTCGSRKSMRNRAVGVASGRGVAFLPP